MPTKPELEDALEAVQDRLADAQETVTWLLELVRGEHDAHHSDAWPVCDHRVCRETQDEAGRIEHAQLMAAS